MAAHRFIAVATIITFMVGAVVASKPNFVIMIMDDMGWGDLGVYGHPAKETPNLDRMAAEGMLFTDFYSGSQICSPSRASLLTARLPVRNGFYSTNKMARNSYAPQDVMGGIADSEVLISEVLKEHGYRNKIVGKWHLGHCPQYLPLKHGFHEWFGAPNCHYKYDDKVMPNIPVYRNEEMLGRYYDDFKMDHSTGISNMTQLYIKEAVEFLEEQAKKSEPFFLYWAPDATHTPLYASEKFRGKSERGLYGDAVMELDSGVGAILGTLKKLGLENNTFAFFTSDNGAATYAFIDGGSNGPFLCGKQTTFEGGMRQPSLAWWPGKVPAGKVSRQVGNLMDLMPTMADIAGVPLPKDLALDGHSITATLFKDNEPYDRVGIMTKSSAKRRLGLGSADPVHKRPIFMYRGDTLFKVRYGHYKAHFYTWGSPLFAQRLNYHYCPGQNVPNVTTEEMMDYSHKPLLFHLGRDPGEKFIIDPLSEEYSKAMEKIWEVAKAHHSTMKRAKPEFNWCDLAVQNWTPEGCEKINRCMKAPPSYPYMCDWPY